MQVLPPHVDAELAAKEGWWKDPDYILFELNVNSTISSPGHDERILLAQNKPYTIKGYAYSGGGRKITRVEVSFDGGAYPTVSRFTPKLLADYPPSLQTCMIDVSDLHS
jgi:hypothetical protein